MNINIFKSHKYNHRRDAEDLERNRKERSRREALPRLILLLIIITAFTFSACSKSKDNKKNNKQGGVLNVKEVDPATDELLSQYAKDPVYKDFMTAVEAVDSKDNKIKVYVPKSVDLQQVKITDGVEYREILADNETFLTNNFIKIDLPENSKRTLVKINTDTKPYGVKTFGLMTIDGMIVPYDGFVTRFVPFSYSEEKSMVDVNLDVINGSINFALIKLKE